MYVAMPDIGGVDALKVCDSLLTADNGLCNCGVKFDGAADTEFAVLPLYMAVPLMGGVDATEVCELSLSPQPLKLLFGV